MPKREISPETLDAAFGRLQQEVSRRVHAPPVGTLIRKSRTRTRRRLALAATASIAAAFATVFLLLPDDGGNPAPVKPASVELSVPLVNGHPAAVPPGPEVWTEPPVLVEVTATNTGERPLEDVTASGAGGNLTCDATQLDPGESTTCSTNVTPGLGPRELKVRVTASYSDAETVSDRIAVFYQGTPPPLASVELSEPTVNEQSAIEAPGPLVSTDQPAVVGVLVTNSGDLPLASLTASIIEDGRALTCDTTGLALDDEVMCSVVVRLEVGEGELDVQVTATDPDGETVGDTITVHYTGEPPPPSTEAFLTDDDANTILGSWTGGTFEPSSDTPSALEFPESCAPDPLPNASENVLVDGQNAAISTTIALLPTDGDAQQATADLVDQVSRCVESRPARDQVFISLPTSSATGDAQAFGVVVGAGRSAAQSEYIVVARDGTAVGVSTFAVYAQDTLPETTLDDLADRVLDRLGAAS